MNELKKIAVPYMQGKMYIFLRNLIYRWPLDDSFRLVLELWLSFIQPWRYPGNEQLELMGLTKQHDADGLSRPSKLADKEYLPFIVENILAYVVIFQQLLPRFTKVDLSSPKIALMLYRMLKVMGQPMLADMLREVESALENINNSPTHVRWPSSVPPLSPTSSWCSTNTSPNISFNKDHSHNLSYMGAASLSGSFIDSSVTYRGIGGKWSNIVKQKIVELECPNFCYKPLFTTQPAQEVFDLIRHIQKAQHAANAIIRLRKEEESKSSRGIFGFLRIIFTQPDFNNDEFPLEEREKVPIVLKYSLEFLVDIFQIRNLNVSGISNDGSTDLNDLSSQIHKDDFPYILTPQRVRERVKNLRFEGDPDLQPIRSNENTFLVRILYQLSKKINEEFYYHINRLYYDQSFVGRICREVVSPPITVYKYEKSNDGLSPRIQESLPPRITLRPLASHKFLTYLALGFIVFNFCGYGIVSYLFFVFSLWSMSILLRVIIPKRRHCDSPTRLLNLNLNDSFS
ncbi:sphingomyelin phosphodiesterase 4 [Agrilus planipennis]|uniref:Sphingomyelin phosphodiesterase 4 n=1 Tax=Agrilus planipennis TaxID=224129 RepID=A0A7F5RJ15_AGRPL|nr:sphingomyelin phosphodiesterase 4 [Agrilus planipennis]